jgi:hypothetical protein
MDRIQNTTSNSSSIAACVFVAAGNVFTKPLPSNGSRMVPLFQFSGVGGTQTGGQKSDIIRDFFFKIGRVKIEIILQNIKLE